MRNRKIPFGYQYENGTVVIHPYEQQIVKRIFDSYQQGMSLLKIAEMLNKEKIEYMPNVYGWNKARIMRIVEDKRYLGTDTFPPIIDSKLFNEIQKIKEEKNTQKEINLKSDIFQMKATVICPNCGKQMRRQTESKCKCRQRWVCKNSECHTIIKISDEELLQKITETMNVPINHPQIIKDAEKSTIEPNNDVHRLENEIARTVDGIGYDKETVKNKMLECVSLKYAKIQSTTYITKKLKADFEKSSPLSIFSADLCSRTVELIKLDTDKQVSLILTNGQEIRKETA